MFNSGATLTVLPSSMESVALLLFFLLFICFLMPKQETLTALRTSPSCYDGLLRKTSFPPADSARQSPLGHLTQIEIETDSHQ